MENINVYYTIHAGLHNNQGFIVPKGITIKLYGIPGIITTRNDYLPGDGFCVEFKEGDFIYDLRFESYPTESELRLKYYSDLKDRHDITYILLNKPNRGGIDKETKLQDRFFMFKDLSDDEIKNYEDEGKYIFDINYTLSKLCYDLKYDLLVKYKHITINSIACLGYDKGESSICDSIINIFLGINTLGKKYISYMYNTYDLRKILNYIIDYIVYDTTKKKEITDMIQKGDTIYGSIQLIKLYIRSHMSIFVSITDGNTDSSISLLNDIMSKLKEYDDSIEIEYVEENGRIIKILVIVSINISFEKLEKFRGEMKSVVKIKKNNNEYNDYKEALKRKSLDYNPEDYQLHANNKLIKHLRNFYNEIKSYTQYNCINTYIEYILNYCETDIVIIPYDFICIILRLIECYDKQYLIVLSSGNDIMCNVNKLEIIRSKYFKTMENLKHKKVQICIHNLEYYQKQLDSNKNHLTSLNMKMTNVDEYNPKNKTKDEKRILKFNKEISKYTELINTETDKCNKIKEKLESINSKFLQETEGIEDGISSGILRLRYNLHLLKR